MPKPDHIFETEKQSPYSRYKIWRVSVYEIDHKTLRKMTIIDPKRRTDNQFKKYLSSKFGPERIVSFEPTQEL